MTLDFAVARENMVENQVRTNDVTDLAIQDAMRVAPRERFCAASKSYLAYAEGEIEYAPGLRLMAARDISKLLQALAPKPGETALAVCAPYAAMLLCLIGLKTTLRVPEGAVAAATQALQGYDVVIEAGDPALAPGGPYALMVVEGAVPLAPGAWVDALGAGGRLGVVERSGPVGKARIYLHGDHARAASRELFDATPSMLPGFTPQPSFAF
jgi:protein-L-isoaspartate(D-aspartate) O-methyltransferase